MTSEGWSFPFDSGRDDEDFVFGDDEEGEESEDKTNKDALIFLVDCNASMFETNPAGDSQSWFESCMATITSAVKNKIIASPNDYVGLVFFCSKVKKNGHNFEGVYVQQPLEQPSASLIKAFENLGDAKTFNSTVGSGDPDRFEFQHALWVCGDLFTESGLKNASKRVVVLTNQDDPNRSKADLKARALQKLKDLEDLDISLSVIPIGAEKGKFDPRKFWLDAVSLDEDDAFDQLVTMGASSLEEMERKFRKKMYTKRSLGLLPFHLAPELALNVKVFCMLRTASKDYGRAVDAKSNAPLHTRTSWLCQDTTKVLEDHEIKTFFPYGGEKVIFKKEETKEIKDFGPPSLTLMGFKPLDRLKAYHNIKNPYFIYPDEATVKGSTVAFHAFVKEMVRKGKFAVARFNARKGSIPRFVALLAQDEELNPDGSQNRPPGMHMIFLPYADDVRHPKFEPTPIAEPELIAKAKQVIRSLPAKFDEYTFENPSLQQHYSVIQAFALEEEAPEEVVDFTLPDDASFERVEAVISDLAAAVGDLDAPDTGSSRKRKTTATAKRGAATKRQKRGDDDGEDEPEHNWEELVTTGKLAKLTIPNLKIYLRKHGLPLSGKKADLLERIETHFAKKAAGGSDSSRPKAKSKAGAKRR